jgi:acyl-CoA synthetase (AMP-forming)/AMP-acid ligase II
MRLSDYLDTAASRHPDKEAIVFGDVRLTYGQARGFVHAIATGLARLRERASLERMHVAILSPNDWRVPLIQLGANRADAVWLALHDRNPPEVNAEVCAGMDGHVVFFHSSHRAAVAKLKPQLPAVVEWVCIDTDTDQGASLQQWLEGCQQTYEYVPAERDAPACILPTGGTTGPSKGALHSHHSTEFTIVAMSVAYDFGTDARLLTVAPLSHAAGHVAFSLLPNGGTNVVHNGFDADAVVDTIARERITHMFLPPTVLYMLMAHPAMARRDFSSLRCLILGAAPVAPNKFMEAVRLFGPVVFEGYAQTETLMPVLVKRPDDYIRADGSIDESIMRSAGRAAAYCRVEIVDDDGVPVPRGERGEIAVRASQGMTSYYNKPEATEEVRKNGFHLTGDIGVMDAGGFVTIVDRKKEMIVTGGFNVFPAEVEAVINQHESVMDCIVIGVPDSKWGEAIRALVQLKQGRTATADEIIALCKERLGGVKTPKAIDFRTELPRSPVGKLLRREARAEFWRGEWRSV